MSDRAVAVCLMLLSLVCFDIMSVLVRTLSANHAPQELSAWRNLFGLLPSMGFLLGSGQLRPGQKLIFPQWKLAVARGLAITGAQFCLYTSLAVVALATVSALQQTVALFTVLFTVILLREKVGPTRIAALALGFTGALWIIRPGSELFTPAALLPVVAAIGYGFAASSSKLFDPAISSARIYVVSVGTSAIGSFTLAFSTSGFAPFVSTGEFFLTVLMGLCGGTAALLQMLAYRRAPAGLLAPMQYFSILTAFAFGWVFFGEAPIDRLFPGAFLIVGAGLMLIWRNNSRKS